MILEKEELRKLLCSAFDSGVQSPFEMMDQEIDAIMATVLAKLPTASSGDIVTWGDYIRAFKNNEPWITLKS